jgi:hypothetical protein
MTAPDGTITDWAEVTRHLDALYAAFEGLETIFAGRNSPSMVIWSVASARWSRPICSGLS